LSVIATVAERVPKTPVSGNAVDRIGSSGSRPDWPLRVDSRRSRM
jgi:hypothetical protein